MKKSAKALISIFIMFVILCSFPALALTPSELFPEAASSTATFSNIADQTSGEPESTPAAAGAPSPQKKEEASIDFKQWKGDVHTQNFSSDHYMKGLFSTVTEYFNVGNWDVKGARLVLSFATTQLLRADSSDFTIYLNEQPIYSGSIPETNGETATLTVELPADEITPDATNSIKISAYMRAGADDACVDYASDVNWVNLFEESQVAVAYQTRFQPASIGALYKQLTAIDALENDRSAILLSGSSQGALTAAGWASAGLAGNAVFDYTKLPIAPADLAALSKAKYVLYIGDYDALLPEIAALLSQKQQEAAQSGALAAVLQYQDTDVLLVTGKDSSALANAGNMLANADYMEQLGTTEKNISPADDFRMEAYRVDQYTPLTGIGAYVNGSYRQTASFYIDWPANRAVASSSELSLDIRYSDNVDFDRSLVTVYVNDIPMGSKRLDKEQADGMTIDLSFPEDVEISGSFTVKVAFDLEAGDDWCRLSPEEMPWGYVAPTSMLKLKSVDVEQLLFDHYPSPFVRDGSFNNTVFILPDELSAADIQAMHEICAGFGRFLKDNRGTLRVCRASEAGEPGPENMIILGAAGKNIGEQLFQDHLYLSFQNGTVTSLSDKLKLDPEYGRTAGTGQLIPSPYNGEAAVMVLSGASGPDMLRASGNLGDTDLLWKLKGDTFIAEQDLAVYTLGDFEKEIQEDEETTERQRQAVNIMLVAGLVLVLCALALIMIVWKRRRNRA